MVLHKIYIILFTGVLLLVKPSFGQLHCGTVDIVPNTSVNELLTFDSFSQYQGGIIINSVARIRVRVTDQAVPDPLCSWHLYMIVDNNPGGGTPINEWEELTQYGNGLNINPPINSLEIRVRNGCQTSPIDGVFQTFTNNGDIIDIIAQMLLITPAGSCAPNVNGPGDYLTNYNEYNFDIDVRVKPSFQFNPGIYQLNVKFHLEENP